MCPTSKIHNKFFSEILSKAVKDYENKFGEIKKPEELKKAEDMMKKDSHFIVYAINRNLEISKKQQLYTLDGIVLMKDR